MKVLVISHNSISSLNNMGKSFLSLFSAFDKEELCQLYIYPTVPDCDFCNSYYRITDKDVLKMLLKRKNSSGEIDKKRINGNQTLYEHPADENLYRNRKNKSAVRRLLRDMMWNMTHWYGEDLENWLEKENPTCIFVAPGVAKFIYEMALKIAKRRNIPIVTYICDEYIFVQKPEKLLDRIQLILLQKKMKELLSCTKHLVVISDELNRIYSRFFQVSTTTVMTGSNKQEKEIDFEKTIENICYFGNIRCNRYLSLIDLGKVLDEINKEQGTEYRLHIYTAEKDSDILNAFLEIQSVDIQEFVSGEKFNEVFYSADALVHVEAFDEESIDRVKHSISTKIADSLASGIPFLAYGPKAVSSINYLIENDCAFVADSEKKLKSVILELLQNSEKRKVVSRKAVDLAEQNHDDHKSSETLRQILDVE